MTNAEAKKILVAYIACESKKAHFKCSEYNCNDDCPLLYDMGTVGEYNEAINIAIQALEQTRWIPVSERLPKEREWIGTDTFGTTISDEVYVTFEMPNSERFTDHLSFQNGKLSNFKQSEIDAWHKGAKPIAWMPLPLPWKGE